MENPLHQVFKELLLRYPDLEPCAHDIAAAGELLLKAVTGGKKILVCGNGGSAADADHITGELLKSFRKKRPIDPALGERLAALDSDTGTLLAASLQGGIPAICLCFHTALSTAFGNDVNPALVFAQQVSVYGEAGDVFWGISTSGNAENVYAAALTAKAKDLTLIGMTGEGGGKLRRLCDVCLAVPRTETYQVQELHLPVYHALCLYLEERLWGGGV